MNVIYKIGIWMWVLVALTACRQARSKSAGTDGSPAVDSVYVPRYAKGFRITYRSDSVRLVDIQEPTKADAPVEHFALIPHGQQANDIPQDYTIIRTPVRRIVCMTTPQLKAFSLMDAYDCVVATSDTRRMQNPEWLARLDDERVKRIGIEGNFNTEIVMATNPELILVSPHRRGGYEVLAETGAPLMPYWAFNETSALGLSEWIRLSGLLIGKEPEAIALFASMEREYNYWKAVASKAERRPTVMSGELRAGHWYVPGGQSFYARLFADAGADYFYKDDPRTGGVILDFETVYARAHDVEFWRVMNGFPGTFTYEALEASDKRYADFRAFRERKVIYCNLEYEPLYENMAGIPHILLKDMIKAMHPELLPDYEPQFYRRLE